VNIFDFDRDIYGESLTVHFHKLLRNDEKFESLDAMTTQLQRDKANALQVLKMNA
jgi:riboflavin kinase/FMN adenylyltransferase